MIVGANVSEHATPTYGESHRPYIAAMHACTAHAPVAPHAAGIGLHTVSPSRAPPRYATSTCVSAAVNTTMLWRGLVKAGVYQARPGWGALLLKIVIANAAMAALLIWLGGDISGWLEATPLHRAARLAMCIVAAAASYFAVLFICGLRLRHMRGAASH